MNLDEMYQSIQEAKSTISMADNMVGVMLKICVGRLRKSGVGGTVLTALKKELRDWDMHRREWIERK